MSKGSIWDAGTENDPPFVREMLTSPTNVNVGLASMAAGAVLAIPFGLLGFAAPVVGFLAADAIAAMYVPDMPSFRESVRAKHRRRRRDRIRDHLVSQLYQHAASESDDRWLPYQRIMARAQSLRELAQDRTSAISAHDAERMEDAALDYLALWLTVQSIEDRLGAMNDAGVQQRLRQIEKELAASDRSVGRRDLQRAKADLDSLAANQRLLASRRSAAEAAMIKLPDAVEEIYHSAITSPSSGGVKAQLDEVIAQLRVEDDLSDITNALDLELDSPPPAARAAARAVKH